MAAIIGHSTGARISCSLRWSWSGEWWLEAEPWWMLETILLVSYNSGYSVRDGSYNGLRLSLVRFCCHPSENLYFLGNRKFPLDSVKTPLKRPLFFPISH